MKYCIITGANSGIGYQAALQISQKGYAVTLVCRNEERAKNACKKIKEETKGEADYLIADLSDMGSVYRIAKEYMSAHNKLDVLINNAADFDLSVKKPVITADGMERQFATNVAAPFLLPQLLLPILQNGRIINISSKGLCVYPNIKLDFENLNGEKRYTPSATYYQNKLALLMLSLYMREHMTDIKVQAVRVTNVKIDMSRYDNIPYILKKMYSLKSLFSISPLEMAKVYTALATEEGYEGFLYDENCREVRANKAVYDYEQQARLVHFLQRVTQK